MKLTKYDLETEIKKGGSTKEIATRLGIPVSKFKDGCKKYSLNLHKKPRVVVEFEDEITESITFNNPQLQEFEESPSTKFESTLVKDQVL